ncbi:MAG: hypothetical protein DMC59_08605 [Verrucomicrobia bacterium]|nr:MAG: hypothetical protein DMC59_08605 [Verrucomicrobiota bacterium]
MAHKWRTASYRYPNHLRTKRLALASARREITFITKSQRTVVCSKLFLRDHRSEPFTLKALDEFLCTD